jgi:transcriptional regulator with XRE-family HTH domain
MIRDAREREGLSLRNVGEAMGLSGPYLHDVEHDRRRLVVRRWASLIAAIPSIDLRALAEQSVSTGPVEIEGESLTTKQRAALVEVLISTVEADAKAKRKGARS